MCNPYKSIKQDTQRLFGIQPIRLMVVTILEKNVMAIYDQHLGCIVRLTHYRLAIAKNGGYSLHHLVKMRL